MDMPIESEIETYMRGECHIHALASIQLHGGHLAICYDDSEIYFEDENGDTSRRSTACGRSTPWRATCGSSRRRSPSCRSSIATFLSTHGMSLKTAYGLS